MGAEADVASQPCLPCRSLASSGRYELLFCWCFLQVWIEFGRIKLPQGYHPNDVEEEWGKLIIEMLEREKLLRPAVERWAPLCAPQGQPCAQGGGPVPFSHFSRPSLQAGTAAANRQQNPEWRSEL